MHIHHHTKSDGRDLFLYSEQQREYQITNDLEPLENPPDPHMRWHPLRQEWVLYNAGRNNRTFHPPSGYNPLAPVAADGFPGEIPTPDFEIAVFENRWPGLSMQATGADLGISSETPAALGRCEVVVYGTEIEDMIYDMSDERVALLMSAWGHRFEALRALENVSYVLPFESRGKFVGVTLPHPHGQIYSFGFIPPIVERQAKAEAEQGVLKGLVADHDLTHAYGVTGDADQARVVVPKFARYPFETWILPPRAVDHPGQLSGEERLELAKALRGTVKALDALFDNIMPFCLWVSLPPKGYEGKWPFHIQIWPMQRSEGKMKYLASVEQLTQVFLVDVMPENAAKALKDAFDV